MTNNTPAPADLASRIKTAIEGIQYSPYGGEGTLLEFVEHTWVGNDADKIFAAVSQAAITAMQAYMASDGVTQMDRDAAAPYANCLSDMQGIFDGKADHLPVVQAFAAHRRAAAITPQPDPSCIELREALDWALNEIRCNTRYDSEEQFWNAYDCARAALAKSGE